MYPFGGILVAPLAAGYFASLLCRYYRRRDKRPGWVAGILAIFGGVLIALVCMFQFDLFIPSRWAAAGGKVHLLPLFGMIGFLAAVAGIIPAAFVVDRHQKQYDTSHTVA
jgi:hypothetical protein